jgi:glycosyltransferase involved in cell wall biosynthesis
LVNNRSTDSSGEIARRYAGSDRRVRLLETDELLPQVPNYNYALRQISPDSRYVKVVEADNWIYPDCLSQMVSLAEAHPRVGIVSSYSATETSVRFHGVHISRSVVPGSEAARMHMLGDAYWFGAPTTVLMRASFVRSRSPFYSENAPIAEDLMACYDALKELDLGFVHQVLSFVRTENESILSKRRNLPGVTLWDKLILLEHCGSTFLSNPELRDARRRIRSLLYRTLAEGCLYRHHAHNKVLWELNAVAMRQIGETPSYPMLAWYLLRTLASAILNPGRAIGLVVGRIGGA